MSFVPVGLSTGVRKTATKDAIGVTYLFKPDQFKIWSDRGRE